MIRGGCLRLRRPLMKVVLLVETIVVMTVVMIVSEAVARLVGSGICRYKKKGGSAVTNRRC